MTKQILDKRLSATATVLHTINQKVYKKDLASQDAYRFLSGMQLNKSNSLVRVENPASDNAPRFFIINNKSYMYTEYW